MDFINSVSNLSEWAYSAVIQSSFTEISPVVAVALTAIAVVASAFAYWGFSSFNNHVEVIPPKPSKEVAKNVPVVVKPPVKPVRTRPKKKAASPPPEPVKPSVKSEDDLAPKITVDPPPPPEKKKAESKLSREELDWMNEYCAEKMKIWKGPDSAREKIKPSINHFFAGLSLDHIKEIVKMEKFWELVEAYPEGVAVQFNPDGLEILSIYVTEELEKLPKIALNKTDRINRSNAEGLCRTFSSLIFKLPMNEYLYEKLKILIPHVTLTTALELSLSQRLNELGRKQKEWGKNDDIKVLQSMLKKRPKLKSQLNATSSTNSPAVRKKEHRPTPAPPPKPVVPPKSPEELFGKTDEEFQAYLEKHPEEQNGQLFMYLLERYHSGLCDPMKKAMSASLTKMIKSHYYVENLFEGLQEHHQLALLSLIDTEYMNYLWIIEKAQFTSGKGARDLLCKRMTIYLKNLSHAQFVSSIKGYALSELLDGFPRQAAAELTLARIQAASLYITLDHLEVNASKFLDIKGEAISHYVENIEAALKEQAQDEDVVTYAQFETVVKWIKQGKLLKESTLESLEKDLQALHEKNGNAEMTFSQLQRAVYFIGEIIPNDFKRHKPLMSALEHISEHIPVDDDYQSKTEVIQSQLDQKGWMTSKSDKRKIVSELRKVQSERRLGTWTPLS